jgi:hypothetical protein
MDQTDLPPMIKRPFSTLQLLLGHIPADIPGGAGNMTRLLRFACRCIDSSLRIYRLRVRVRRLMV